VAKKGSSKRPVAGKSGKSPAKAKPVRNAGAVKKSVAPKSPVVAKSATKPSATKPPVASKSRPGKVPTRKPATVIAAPPAKAKKFSSVKQPEREAPAFTPPIQRPVMSNEKPRKNQAGLNSRDLDFFRGLLLEKRREIVGDMSSMEREALRNSGGSNLSNLPIHMADMGTDNYEQEFTLGLVEKDRVLLREINTALAKIQDGSYGICEGTGKPITKVRLEAQPWTRYSIDFARQKERGMLR
jgi:RNA polymerase-binding protein DksA